MSESPEGASVAATRQKAGKAVNCEEAPAGRPGVGGVKAPAATVFADVIVVCGSLREARLSQDAARTGDAAKASIANIKNEIRIFLAATIPLPFLFSSLFFFFLFFTSLQRFRL